MNKSLVTNVVSVALIGVGYAIPSSSIWAYPIRQVGLYATSGAITNWLAIYMLFEKIPGLYGSGVIPSRFEEFKMGIRELIMGQFFTLENVENFLDDQTPGNAFKLKPEPFLEVVDYDAMFKRLVDAVQSSPFGGMLGMFGGTKVLEPLRGPFEVNIREEICALVESPKLHEAIMASTDRPSHAHDIIAKVDVIVQKRLDELTPGLVKEIIQKMIREHLGWLVVWGGVFGALIGLIAALLPQ